MAKLLRNDTVIYYTVRVKDGLYVTHTDIYNGNVTAVRVQEVEEEAYKFINEKGAKQAARYVEGTVTKHTETEIVTVISEDIPVEIEVEDEDEEVPTE